MRNASQIIKDKIDRLVNLMMNEGVQPNDLTENIFLGTYRKIDTSKLNDRVVTSIFFEESVDGILSETNLQYTYSMDKRLLKIEEVRDGYQKIEWDRETIE